jgi:hypothetical protein
MEIAPSYGGRFSLSLSLSLLSVHLIWSGGVRPGRRDSQILIDLFKKNMSRKAKLG